MEEWYNRLLGRLSDFILSDPKFEDAYNENYKFSCAFLFIL